MIIKCKMCGGDIQFNPGDTCGQCDHCGCTTTFPKLPDEQRTNLFNRANHFRRQCEFDKAMAAYEHILEVDDTDAEAHWGIVLSKFGIEYVEDPVTHERIPTCHRAQVISILSDEDYQNAIKYAPDTQSRDIYEQEAKRIAEIQKGILAISSQEKPYDVFICYKETDDNGSRTKDSALAQEIYYQLTNEGYKVFFSRITLEDKLGQEYEPYIFAALNSAKVMLVVGTKPENFSAVWVKNEWSRFLAIMKNDRKRMLIPCYRDMDPYDLPEELSALQSQDMSKIGFVQDLIRGIKKVVEKDTAKQQTVVQHSVGIVANIENLMKRVRLFLEDGDFSNADEYLNRILDEDAEYAPAYIGKILVTLKINREDELSHCLKEYELTPNWQKALRFATPEQKSIYENYLAQAQKAREEKANDEIYDKARKVLSDATTSEECLQAKALFEQISSHKDSAKQIEECNDKALLLDYYKATSRFNRASTEQDCIIAAKEFDRLGDYKDSKEMAKKAREREKRITYNRAKQTLESARTVEACVEAKRLFQSIIDYDDAKVQIEKCQEKADCIPYDNAKAVFDKAKTVSDYKTAKEKFQAISGFRDSFDYIVRCDSRIEKIHDSTYKHAIQYEEGKKWDDAISLHMSLGQYRDCEARIKACRKAKEQEEQERIAQQEQELRLAQEREKKAAAKRKRIMIINAAVFIVVVTTVLLITLVIIPKGHYDRGKSLLAAGNYEQAVKEFEQAGSYSDAKSLLKSDDKLAYAARQLHFRTIGSTVTFGTYEQDNDSSNGKEPIEWIVLDVQNGKSLLISKYGLDAQKYNSFEGDITWERSSIRRWLNGDFLQEAFSTEEQAAIELSDVDNSDSQGVKNAKYSLAKDSGNDTQDHIFLLSYHEAFDLYFSNNQARKCVPTAYAIKQAAYTSSSEKVDGKATGLWWLRSPGDLQKRAAFVGYNGSLGDYVDLKNGYQRFFGDATYKIVSVRPAFWLNIESDIVKEKS